MDCIVYYKLKVFKISLLDKSFYFRPSGLANSKILYLLCVSSTVILSLSFRTAFPQSLIDSRSRTVVLLILPSFELPGSNSPYQAIYRFNLKYHKNEKDNCNLNLRFSSCCYLYLLRFFTRRWCTRRLQNEPGFCRIRRPLSLSLSGPVP